MEDGRSCDVWSMGAVMTCFFCQLDMTPWGDDDSQDKAQSIVKDFQRRNSEPNFCMVADDMVEEAVRHLIVRMLASDRLRRPSSIDVAACLACILEMPQ